MMPVIQPLKEPPPSEEAFYALGGPWAAWARMRLRLSAARGVGRSRGAGGVPPGCAAVTAGGAGGPLPEACPGPGGARGPRRRDGRGPAPS